MLEFFLLSAIDLPSYILLVTAGSTRPILSFLYRYNARVALSVLVNPNSPFHFLKSSSNKQKLRINTTSLASALSQICAMKSVRATNSAATSARFTIDVAQTHLNAIDGDLELRSSRTSARPAMECGRSLNGAEIGIRKQRAMLRHGPPKHHQERGRLLNKVQSGCSAPEAKRLRQIPSTLQPFHALQAFETGTKMDQYIAF